MTALARAARCDTCLQPLLPGAVLAGVMRHAGCGDAYMVDFTRINERAERLGLTAERDAVFRAERDARDAARPSTRGGPRPGAGRPRRDSTALSTPRPGPPMTDAEWAEVLDYAGRVGVSPVEAMRRLIRAGLDSPIG